MKRPPKKQKRVPYPRMTRLFKDKQFGVVAKILDVLVRPSAHGESYADSDPSLSAIDPVICSANVT